MRVPTARAILSPSGVACVRATVRAQPTPRPLDKNGSAFTWDTWSALPWRVWRGNATPANVRVARLGASSARNKSAFVAAVFRAATASEDGDERPERAMPVGGVSQEGASRAEDESEAPRPPAQPHGDEQNDERNSASASAALGSPGETPHVRKQRAYVLSWRWETHLCQLAKSGRLTTRPYHEYVPPDNCCGCLASRLRGRAPAS